MPANSNLGGLDDAANLDAGSAAGPSLDTIQPLNDKPFNTEPVKLSAEEVAQIWRRIDAGLQHQKKAFFPQYRDALRLWKGEHWPGERGSRYDDHLVVNMIVPIVKSKVEAVAFGSQPDWTLRPWNRLGEQNQQTAKAALRYWFREARVIEELKRATYDKELFGYGVVQVGWLFRTEQTTLDAGRLEVLPEGVDRADAVMAEEAGLLSPGETADDFVEADDVIEDRFQVRRINPMDFVVPPNATAVLEDLDWCARIERRPLAQVKGDPQYKSTRGLKGTTELSEPYLSEEVRKLDDERRPPDVRYVELLHYFERDRRLHVVLCRENKTRPLKVEKWGWASRRYPFRTIHNSHTPDEFYGKSTAIELWDQQVELNEARTQNMLHRRQFNRMFQVPQGTLDNKNKNLLYQGEAGTVIEYQNTGVANPIAEIPAIQLQQETYRSYEWSIQGMEQISGLSQYELHHPSPKRMSATEAQQIQGAGGILFMSDAQAFTKLVEEVGEDLLVWTQQFAQVTREIPIYDGDGNVSDWIDFTGEQIRGDYLVEVFANSTQPPDAQSQLSDNQLVLQTLVEAAQFTNPQTGQLPRPMAIVMRQILQTIGVRNVDDLLPLPPATVPPALPPASAPAGGGPPPPSPAPPAVPGPPVRTAPAGPPVMDPTQLQQVINTLPPDVIAQILQAG